MLGFDSFSFLFSSVLILTTGTIFAMWLGEKITDKGIGNGISLLIMVGILARLPQAFIQEFTSTITNNNGGPMLLVIEVIIWLLVSYRLCTFSHGGEKNTGTIRTSYDHR